MKAIAVKPGTKIIRLVDRDEPKIQSPDDVKLQVLRVGICGTDREEAAGGGMEAVARVPGRNGLRKCAGDSKATSKVAVGVSCFLISP